jgi:hypothetical protein
LSHDSARATTGIGFLSDFATARAAWRGEIGKREEGRGKREEGRGKREEGRGKREEGRGSGIKTEDTSEGFLFSFFVFPFSIFHFSFFVLHIFHPIPPIGIDTGRSYTR